jgi:hypothetical protein
MLAAYRFTCSLNKLEFLHYKCIWSYLAVFEETGAIRALQNGGVGQALSLGRRTMNPR